MQVTIKQDELNFALNTVAKAINTNNTLPILSNILIKAKENHLSFSATNLEIAISLNLLSNIDQEGDITIPAKLLTSYVNLLPNEQIELSTDENNQLKIKSKKSQTLIKGLKATDYPSLPQIKNEFKTIKINAKKLERAINETVFSASSNTTRPILSGIFVKAEGKKLTLAATDSYRLAESIIELESALEDKEKVSCIIPSRTMMELSKILSNFNKEIVTITISSNQVLFEIEEIQLISRLLEGAYPDYTKIIPKESKTNVKINAANLSQALKRINLFAKELNNSIHLEINKENNKLIISTDETKLGEEKTELDVEITGENNKISINSQYLLDVLSIKEGEKVVLETNETLSPVKVHPEKNTDYTYIIMPLKV